MSPLNCGGLASGVANWLSEKSSIGLEGLFSESLLAVPIAEFIASESEFSLAREVPHPGFRRLGKGRGEQIDFILKDRATNDWRAAVEVKYLRAGYTCAKYGNLIASDLLRLAAIDKPGIDRYLLLVVERPADAQSFPSNPQDWMVSSRWPEFFRSLLADRPVRLEKCSADEKRFLGNFEHRTNLTILKRPIGYKCARVADDIQGRFAVALWKVCPLTD